MAEKNYRVRLKAMATMTVNVEAPSASEAKRRALALEGEPYTDWTPIDYDRLKATSAEELPNA